MLEKKGQKYPTIKDALAEFDDVTAKTVGEWIEKGIIPRPPQIERGAHRINYYPPEYMVKAKASLKTYRDRKGAKRKDNPKSNS